MEMTIVTTCPTCGKGHRAVLYCHSLACPGLAGTRRSAMPDLPRPTVDVTVTTRTDGGTDLNVVIHRDGKARTFTANQTGGGTGPVKEIVERIIADPHTGEWLPSGKRF